VPEHRVPYSGYIYPDVGGGTISALRKYDRAFNGGRYKAAAHEQWDTTAYAQPVQTQTRGGLFGRRTMTVTRVQTPSWHGHCNGWTSASIRHKEPQKSVTRNGVTFRPADIKALLAEIYIYTHSETVAGNYDYVVNPATLHVILANWLGRQSHPVAMEATPGKEKWNYPIYSFASSFAKRGSNRVEVKTNIAYMHSSQGEQDRSPRISRKKYFHYMLTLNDAGEIIGGSAYRDSSRVDLLWIPIAPVQGGQEGNPRGNPYVNVEDVLAIWRESVGDDPEEQWVNVWPAPEVTEEEGQIAAAESAETAEPETETETASEPATDTTAEVISESQPAASGG